MRVTQLVMAVVVVVPLTWIVAIQWNDARDVAGAATLIVPALVASQELTVLVVRGRLSRKQAVLVRLAVIAAAVLVPNLLNRFL